MNELEELKKLSKKLGEKILLKRNYDKEDYKNLRKLKELLRNNLEDLAGKVLSEESSEVLIAVAEALGILLIRGEVKSNKIRNIFGYVKKLEGETMTDEDELNREIFYKLRLLSPKLAYTVGRASGKERDALSLLKSYFDKLIDRIGNDKKKFKTFIDFFESILAYHKYYDVK